MRQRRPRAKPEPTIALINIVFLMLIFFLVAGTLAKPIPSDLTLVSTQALDQQAPPDALVIHADGQLVHRGTPLPDAAAYLAALEDTARVRIVPDRELPATDLIALGRSLREAGAERVVIVTERALQ